MGRKKKRLRLAAKQARATAQSVPAPVVETAPTPKTSVPSPVKEVAKKKASLKPMAKKTTKPAKKS